MQKLCKTDIDLCYIYTPPPRPHTLVVYYLLHISADTNVT